MSVTPKEFAKQLRRFVSDRGKSANFCSVVSCLGLDYTFENNAIAAGWRVLK